MKCFKCGREPNETEPMIWECNSCNKRYSVNISYLKKILQKKNAAYTNHILKCKNCGKPLDDGNEKIRWKCSCGNIQGGKLVDFDLNGKASQSDKSNISTRSSISNKSNVSDRSNKSGKKTGKLKIAKKHIIISTVVLTAIISGLLLFKFFIKNNSCEQPIDTYVESMNKKIIGTEEWFKIQHGNLYGKCEYILQMPELNDYYPNYEQSEEEEERDTYDNFRSIYGEDWKMTVDILEKKEVDDSKKAIFQGYWSEMLSNLKISYNKLLSSGDEDNLNRAKSCEKDLESLLNTKVDEVYSINLKVHMKGSRDTVEYDMNVYSVKIGDFWIMQDEYGHFPVF